MAKKTWDAQKRFFKYSESLLSLPPQKSTAGVHILFKALIDLYSTEKIAYFIGDQQISFYRGKPVQTQSSLPQGNPEFHFPTPEGEHRLYLSGPRPKGKQKKYLALLLALYQRNALSSAVSEPPKQAQTPQPPHAKEQPQKTAPSQEERSPAKEQEEKTRFFLRHLFEELLSRISLFQGWLALQPLPEPKGLVKEVQPCELLSAKLKHLNELFTALSQIQTRPEQVQPDPPTPLPMLCHQVIEALPEKEEGKNFVFELAEELNHRQLTGNRYELTQGISFLLDCFVRLQELIEPDQPLKLAFRAPQKGVFCLYVTPFMLPEGAAHWLEIPPSLYDSLAYGFQLPSLYLYLANWYLRRNKGKLTLTLQSGELLAQIDFRSAPKTK